MMSQHLASRDVDLTELIMRRLFQNESLKARNIYHPHPRLPYLQTHHFQHHQSYFTDCYL